MFVTYEKSLLLIATNTNVKVGYGTGKTTDLQCTYWWYGGTVILQ